MPRVPYANIIKGFFISYNRNSPYFSIFSWVCYIIARFFIGSLPRVVPADIV